MLDPRVDQNGLPPLQVDFLKDENAALRARTEAAVEKDEGEEGVEREEEGPHAQIRKLQAQVNGRGWRGAGGVALWSGR